MKKNFIRLFVFAAGPFLASGADFTVSPAVWHAGQPDGSAGIAAGEEHFIGATDEDNTLRLYARKDGTVVKEILDLNPVLGFAPKKDKFRECDLEGAARMGDTIYWIGSHGTNKEGEERKERQVLIATTVSGTGAKATLTFQGAYKDLLQALGADAQLEAKFGLAKAAQTAPEQGGLNIEALCTKDTSLLIGFRSPLFKEGALILPLMNPKDVIADKAPVFGDAILLDLGGLGIRDMTQWRGQYLIVAGGRTDKVKGEPKAKLYRWTGNANQKPVLLEGDLGDLNPEGAIVYGDGAKAELQLLCDDVPAFRSVEVAPAQ